MNVEFRIAKLERLISDVSLRRARAPRAGRSKPDRQTSVAGWDSLERGFRTALRSLEQQRGAAEIGG
jgi:hypothetical protein